MTAAQIEQLARTGRAVTKVKFLNSKRIVLDLGSSAHAVTCLMSSRNRWMEVWETVALRLYSPSLATTVSATMELAAMAGINVFATGGIGGVHRGAESTWDVSADLRFVGCSFEYSHGVSSSREFSKSPVIVISAGAKAILDLPKTLEYLETEGVCCPLVFFVLHCLVRPDSCCWIWNERISCVLYAFIGLTASPPRRHASRGLDIIATLSD